MNFSSGTSLVLILVSLRSAVGGFSGTSAVGNLIQDALVFILCVVVTIHNRVCPHYPHLWLSSVAIATPSVLLHFCLTLGWVEERSWKR